MAGKVDGPEISQISIYLTKPNSAFADVIDWGGGVEKREAYVRQEFEIDGHQCWFIYFVSHTLRSNPPWLDFLNAQLPKDGKRTFEHHSKSPNGILGLMVEGRLFLAAFGRSAAGALRRDSIEPDFGIKTAMNLCGNEEIRQTRTQSHSITPTHTDRQTARPSEAFVFGMSEAEDLKFISAHMKSDAKVTLQGRDHLTLKVTGAEKLTWEKLLGHCQSFVDAYGDNAYIKLFPNYRNFKAADPADVAKLDAKLMEIIHGERWDELEMWVPEFMADDEYSFSYSDRAKLENDIYAYLEPKQLAELKLGKATADTLQAKKVYAYSHAQDRILSHKYWSLYACLILECELDGKHFLLTDGSWKEIADDFYDAIVKFVDTQVNEQPFEPAFAGINIADRKQKKNREGIFNEEVVSRRPTAILFDRSQLRVGRDRKNKEFCDILDLADDDRVRIINCKPYSGSSALSYLFAQTRFYCEAFVSDQPFLDEIRTHIKKSKSPKKPEYLKRIKPEQRDVQGSDFRICLWLLCDSKKKLPTRNDMPLMARYELKLMHELLQRVYNFRDIRLRFVPVEMANFKTRKRPKAKAA